jgi:hypothetical protein
MRENSQKLEKQQKIQKMVTEQPNSNIISGLNITPAFQALNPIMNPNSNPATRGEVETKTSIIMDQPKQNTPLQPF